MAPSGSKSPSCFFITVLLIVSTIVILTVTMSHDDILSIVDGLHACNSQGRYPVYNPAQQASTHTSSYATQPYTFHDIPSIENLDRPTDEVFESFLTREGGFLQVQPNNDTELSHIRGDEIESWGVSMFHSLHCLSMLHEVLRSVPGLQNLARPAGGQHDGQQHHHRLRQRQRDSHDGHEESIFHDPGHVGHCVAYIAQMLMCAADDTIEPPWVVQESDGSIFFGVSGDGYRHQCKDASLI